MAKKNSKHKETQKINERKKYYSNLNFFNQSSLLKIISACFYLQRGVEKYKWKHRQEITRMRCQQQSVRRRVSYMETSVHINTEHNSQYMAITKYKEYTLCAECNVHNLYCGHFISNNVVTIIITPLFVRCLLTTLVASIVLAVDSLLMLRDRHYFLFTHFCVLINMFAVLYGSIRIIPCRFAITFCRIFAHNCGLRPLVPGQPGYTTLHAFRSCSFEDIKKPLSSMTMKCLNNLWPLIRFSRYWLQFDSL